MSSLLLPIIIVVIGLMMFFSVRKQKRNAQQQKDLQNSITPGDVVMTTSGLYGTVVSTSDNTIDLEIAPDMITTWIRQAVQKKVEDGESPYEPDTSDYDELEAEAEYEVDGDGKPNGDSGVRLEKDLETSGVDSLEHRKN